MQILNLKFPLKIALFLLVSSQLVKGEDINAKIKTADSLFYKKQFTQSFEIYQHIFEKDKQYSPQMLLKMAYIQEGLNNYTGALYYLNTYYLNTNDDKVLNKIEDLAEKHKLKGYEYSDFRFMYHLVQKYEPVIVFLFTLSLFVLIVWLLLLSFKKKRSVKWPAFFVLVFLLGVFAFNVLMQTYSTAIISESTYLMQAPSSGSEVAESVKKGNKISILGEDDIWLKVIFDNKKGYIRKNTALLLQD